MASSAKRVIAIDKTLNKTPSLLAEKCRQTQQSKCLHRNSFDGLIVCLFCDNVIHPDCFFAFLEKAKKDVPMTANGEAVIACSMKCYKKVMKSGNVTNGSKNDKPSERSKRVNWTTDHAIDSDRSSMKVLIDWLTTEGNYAAYRGGEGHNGRSKTDHAKQIVQLFVDAGVIVKRTPQDVIGKIQWLESTYREAVDWLHNTGAGLSDPGDIDEAVTKRCKYYHELAPIMQDIGNTRPLITNESDTSETEAESVCVGEDKSKSAVTPFVVEQESPKKKAFPSIAVFSQEAVEASQKLSSKLNPKRHCMSLEVPSKVEARKENTPAPVMLASAKKISIRSGGNKRAKKANPDDFMMQFMQSKQIEVETKKMEIESSLQDKKLTRQQKELEMEDSKRHADIKFKTEYLLQRNNLLKQGISQEVVDSVFPLSALVGAQTNTRVKSTTSSTSIRGDGTIMGTRVLAVPVPQSRRVAPVRNTNTTGATDSMMGAGESVNESQVLEVCELSSGGSGESDDSSCLKWDAPFSTGV